MAYESRMPESINKGVCNKTSAHVRVRSSGATRGSVILENTNQREARSMAAASYSEGGIADSPASDSNMTNGDHIQMSVIATAISATMGSDSHTIPSVCSRWLTMPQEG